MLLPSHDIHFKGTEKASAVQVPNWNTNKDFYKSYGAVWAAKQMIWCCTLCLFHIIVSALEMKKWFMAQNDPVLSGPRESSEEKGNERERKRKKPSSFHCFQQRNLLLSTAPPSGKLPLTGSESSVVHACTHAQVTTPASWSSPGMQVSVRASRSSPGMLDELLISEKNLRPSYTAWVEEDNR